MDVKMLYAHEANKSSFNRGIHPCHVLANAVPTPLMSV